MSFLGTGEVLVAVNPYRQLNIYSNEVVEKYRNRAHYEQPPHIFAIADAAYQAMKYRRIDTCIVISGTSAHTYHDNNFHLFLVHEF